MSWNSASKVVPLLTVFHTPPCAVATYIAGFASKTARSECGPTSRRGRPGGSGGIEGSAAGDRCGLLAAAGERGAREGDGKRHTGND